MTRILSILRAAHCRSTHHYFAIDALQNMRTAQAQRLANILLQYHDEYLVGAKAPDSNFKDFQNHVVHVSDNNWGGAPLKCEEWLGLTRDYLDKGKWKKAAYACGVLSHYFTDPIMPLHTAQTAREQVIHRPLEWSVCQSYDEIYKLSIESGYCCDFELSQEPQWIGKAVLAAAGLSHQYYDRLISIYDLEQGVAVPRQGLNDEAMSILAELFSIAINGWSSVLTRLADETTIELPQVSLTLTSLLATLDMPLAWIVRKISDSSERRAVHVILKEYRKTGTLKRNLPAEITVVRDKRIEDPTLGLPDKVSYKISLDQMKPDPLEMKQTESKSNSTEIVSIASANENELARSLQSASTNLEHLSSPAQVVGRTIPETGNSPESPVSNEDAPEIDFFAGEETHGTQGVQEREREREQTLESETSTDFGSDADSPQFVSLSEARSRKRSILNPSELSLAPLGQSNSQPSESTAFPTSDFRGTLRIAPGTLIPNQEIDVHSVTYDSPVVEAPSIGPKTAKRLEGIGITTIRQLVSTSTEEIVQGLATRWISASLVQDWQDQARLVCEVPELTCYRAQLLVAIGCRTSWQLRTSNPATLHSQVSQFVQTAEGQQILRSAKPPMITDVVKWIDSARSFARRDVA